MKVVHQKRGASKERADGKMKNVEVLENFGHG